MSWIVSECLHHTITSPSHLHLPAGDSMGSGGMLRSVSRAVGAAVGGIHPLSSSKSRPTTTTALSLPSSTSPSLAVPVSVAPSTWNILPAVRDLDDWEYLQVEEEEGELVEVEKEAVHAFGGLGLGPVPALDEVEDAVAALRKVAAAVVYSGSSSHGRDSPASNQDGSVQSISPIDSMRHGTSSGSDSDWTEPAAMQLYHGSIALQNDGYYRNVIDAFRLLQINPSVQRMVVSLSSDRAVWEAVMRNEAVREIKESLLGSVHENTESAQGYEENSAVGFMKWMVKTTREKMSEFIISKIMKLVNDLFQPSEKAKMRHGFDHDTLIKSSFMLSVVVLLLVVVGRVQRA